MDKDKTSENIENVDKCFIITPIGSDNSPIRREIDGVIFSVIEPILRDFNLEPVVAHQISSPGSINNQVINHIVNDKLVIANLTELNPNVMYELAIRHATKKPVIHICREDTVLPFDIKTERALFYKNDMHGSLELKKSLKLMISEALSKEEWDDNPIYNAVKFDFFTKLKTEDTDANFNEFFLNAFQAIQEDLKEIKRGFQNKKTSTLNWSTGASNLDSYATRLLATKDFGTISVNLPPNFLCTDKMESTKNSNEDTDIEEKDDSESKAP